MSEELLTFLKREDCPVCRSKDATLIYDKMFVEDPIREYVRLWYKGVVPVSRFGTSRYAVMECLSCGLLYQRDVLADDGLALLYGSWIDSEASAQRSLARARRDGLAVARQVHALGRLFGSDPGAVQIVDFGCGWGSWLLMARAFGYGVMGVEIDGQRMAALAAEGIPCCKNCCELPNESADFIQAEQVFEHLRQPRDVLESLVRALNPGGFLQISVPNARWVKRNLERLSFSDRRTIAAKGVRRSLSPIAPLEHVNAFAGKSLLTLGSDAGLRLCSTRSLLFPGRSLGGYAQRLARFVQSATVGTAAKCIVFRKD